ncbi:lactosylceramide 4-alpha-galactosyltransferase [Pleurodeles waltl]
MERLLYWKKTILGVKTMRKLSAYVFWLSKAARRNKLRSTCVVIVKLISFVSIMFYLGLTKNSSNMTAPYRLPSEVKCPVIEARASRESSNSSQDGNIFFIETSDRMHPNFLFLCSVESAARAHPESKVRVLMKGLSGSNPRIPRSMGLSLLGCFPNIEVKPLDLKDLFANTPLAPWYSSTLRKWEPYQLPILSDACRIALIWKFGGIYLDTDFIVLKNLKNLTNSIGIQSRYLLNGAFLSFDRRHKFMEHSIQNFVQHYNAWIWGHQGPQLVTRVFKKWCSIRKLIDSQGCKGVSILPQEAFYPIRWQDWKKYFDIINSTEFEGLFQNTYAVHIWNTFTQGKALKIGSKTILDQLFSHNCPFTHSIMKRDH